MNLPGNQRERLVGRNAIRIVDVPVFNAPGTSQPQPRRKTFLHQRQMFCLFERNDMMRQLEVGDLELHGHSRPKRIETYAVFLKSVYRRLRDRTDVVNPKVDRDPS